MFAVLKLNLSNHFSKYQLIDSLLCQTQPKVAQSLEPNLPEPIIQMRQQQKPFFFNLNFLLTVFRNMFN